MGVQRRTVSHFKGLFKTFKMRYIKFMYSYWVGLHVNFKKAILHLKGPLLNTFLPPLENGHFLQLFNFDGLYFCKQVGVQRRTVSHSKGLFKIFKMRYSTFLYSSWVDLNGPIEKGHFTPKNRDSPDIFLSHCNQPLQKWSKNCFH